MNKSVLKFNFQAKSLILTMNSTTNELHMTELICHHLYAFTMTFSFGDKHLKMNKYCCLATLSMPNEMKIIHFLLNFYFPIFGDKFHNSIDCCTFRLLPALCFFFLRKKI